MQTERVPQHTPQEIQVVNLAPEHVLSAMQQALIAMLQTLPVPITIKQQTDTRQRTYYAYQVGERTEEKPIGLALGATPEFLDAMRFSLEAALKQSNEQQKGGMDTL